jgi:hypothetical protein
MGFVERLLATGDSFELLLQVEPSIEVRFGILCGKFDEKVDVAGFRVEIVSECRPEDVEFLYTQTAAHCCYFGAVLLNEWGHGLVSESGGPRVILADRAAP